MEAAAVSAHHSPAAAFSASATRIPVARQPSRNVIEASATSGALRAACAIARLSLASRNMTIAVIARYAMPNGDESAAVPRRDVVDAGGDQVEGEERERYGNEAQGSAHSAVRRVVGDVPDDDQGREHLDERVQADATKAREPAATPKPIVTNTSMRFHAIVAYWRRRPRRSSACCVTIEDANAHLCRSALGHRRTLACPGACPYATPSGPTRRPARSG